VAAEFLWASTLNNFTVIGVGDADTRNIQDGRQAMVWADPAGRINS